MQSTSRAYHPDFEAALEQLLHASADTAEFAAGHPTGRSRQASIRRLAAAVENIHQVSRKIVIAHRAQQLAQLTTLRPTG